MGLTRATWLGVTEPGSEAMVWTSSASRFCLWAGRSRAAPRPSLSLCGAAAGEARVHRAPTDTGLLSPDRGTLAKKAPPERKEARWVQPRSRPSSPSRKTGHGAVGRLCSGTPPADVMSWHSRALSLMTVPWGHSTWSRVLPPLWVPLPTLSFCT